jgi:SAM-dependent methyltransferase
LEAVGLTRIRHPRRWLYERTRRRLAARLIAGSGIEIGALHSPFPVPRGARVRYVDRLTTEQLRAEYPELGAAPLVPVDLVDDGETLSKLADESQDFVIASHFLEHCQDPIGTLRAHLRVLRAGGILLLALPDRRHGVDRSRRATPLDHIVADHERGTKASRAQHYYDWVSLVDVPLGRVAADQVDAHARALEHHGASIHFHCWTRDEFLVQLREIARRYDLPGAVSEHRANQHEFLVALRRTRRPDGA